MSSENSMFIINTTYGWNPGDDLIREGVINLLGIQHESKAFINRGQLIVNGKITPIWKMLKNVESPDYLATHAKAIIMAGTPEWLDFFEEFYKAAAKHSLPIYMVGIGMRSVARRAPALIDSVKHLIKGATVRDTYAAAALAERGIPYEWFPDPAFSASYDVPSSKRYELVVNYRSHGGNGSFTNAFDDKWAEAASKYSSAIDLVTVHEQGEYARAKKIFSAPVFYSSDYMDYKYIYANTKVYLGGRIHGATPVVACGGTAHVIYSNSKISVLSKVAEFVDTLTISSYNQNIPDISCNDPTRALANLKMKEDQHRAYWRARI